MAYPNGYNYRKQIDITGATGGSTGYQVPITVNSGSGTDAAGVAYLGGNATLFPLDIQFTAADGSTVLDYWRETNDDTKFWVEVAADLASNQSIYLYYGLADINQDLDTQNIGSVPYASNPVMTVGAGGQWDDFFVATHSIVKSGSTYYMYYDGAPDATGAYRIGLATSSDGITWSKSGSNPVVTVGSGGSWDDFAVAYPCVWIEGATWYMMYAGMQSGGAWKIGLATSSDGVTWSKDAGNPVMAGTAATWDSGSVIPGTRMIKESSTYYMYYWGHNGGGVATWQIGLATSSDLTTWSKSGSNPVLSGGAAGTWHRGVCEPCVFKINSTYIMLFQGSSTTQDYSNIGMATSTDKTTWTKKGRRVIPRGATGSWNSNWTEAPTLAEDFSPYRVYHSGSQGAAATPRMEVGYAEIAADFSDGDATFQFFDDFDDTSLDTSAKWTNTGTFAENDTNDNNLIKYAANTSTTYICVGKTDVAYPCVLESRAKTDTASQWGWNYALLWDSAWATSGYLAGYYEETGPTYYHKIFQFPDGTSAQTNEAGTTNYRRLGLYINGTNQKFLVDGTQKGAIATTPPQASTKVTLATGRQAATSIFTGLFDWVFARKWTSSGTEPSVGTPGAEETYTPASGSPWYAIAQM